MIRTIQALALLAPGFSAADAPALAARFDLAKPAIVVRGEGRNFSGVCAARNGQSFYVADDNGSILEFTLAGKLVREVKLEGAPDIEDVTLDADEDHLLVVVEATAEILRLSRAELAIVARFKAPREILRSDKGAEGLLLVTDVQGARELWIGHQGDELVYVCSAPVTSGETLKLLRTLAVEDEFRALALDPVSGHVLAAADDHKELRLVDRAGRKLDAVPLSFGPKKTIEGVAFDARGALLVCVDGGDLVRYEPRAAQPIEAAVLRTDVVAHLEHLVSIDVPSFAPEVVAVSADRRVLVHNDAFWKTLEIYELDLGQDKRLPTLVPRDFDEEWDGPQGLPFRGEPTSVATHPKLPFCLVAEVARYPEERGTLHAIDLRAETLGKTLWFVKTGVHPDCVAISLDGRWALVANEGEGDDRAEATPGSVSAFRLDAIDPLTHRNYTGTVPSFEIDVFENVAVDRGEVEPEYVAMDPASRFAVVTCQENNAAVVIDLRGAEPKLSPAKFYLPAGSEPDGCAVLDRYDDPEHGPGALVAFSEEGRFDRVGRWSSQALSLWWLGPEGEFTRTAAIARIDLTTIFGKEHLEPETPILTRQRGRIVLLSTLERADRVAVFDVTETRAPKFLDAPAVGKRPEGMVQVGHEGRLFAIAGCEGNDGPGEVSFLEWILR